MKSTFCTILIESQLFSRIGVNFSPVERFLDLKRWQMQFGQTYSTRPENHVLYNFHRSPTVFTYWRKIQSSRAIFGSETLKNEIWPKLPPHSVKSTFCTIFIESLLFARIGVKFSPVERFLAPKRWKNAIWPKRSPHCLKSTFCTIFIENVLFSRIRVKFSPVERLLAPKRWKCDLTETSSPLHEKHVLYNFYRKPTVLTYWREFQSGRAIFGSKTLRNAIWPKRPTHSVKSTFCTIFIESLLFWRIRVNLSPVERFLAPKRWKMRFGQNVLRMA